MYFKNSDCLSEYFIFRKSIKMSHKFLANDCSNMYHYNSLTFDNRLVNSMMNEIVEDCDILSVHSRRDSNRRELDQRFSVNLPMI